MRDSNFKVTPPTILVGMHRSGTSMIARLLKEMGLFIGWELENHDEAVFFLNRNDKILKSSNGGWDNPLPVLNLLGHEKMRKQVSLQLLKDMNSIQSFSFLGPKKYLKYKSIYNLDIPWGWKDPRSSVLLPLWLDIFPNAKIVNVYRNGVDSAESLYVRENQRVDHILGCKDSTSARTGRQVSILKDTGPLLYSVQIIRQFLKRLGFFYKYDRFRVNGSISREGAFKIWETYIDLISGFVKNKKNVLNIKYEDFLNEPNFGLKSLSDFCCLQTSSGTINRLTTAVRKNRAYAFLNNNELLLFYQKHKETEYMKNLGYDSIL